jgi:thiol-disulfide isomerase/thioredoxin
MRKILNTILVISSLIFASCENYDENERLIPIIGETDLTTPITKQQSEQAILVEDFTGWNCPNCPGGTEVLETEMGKYGERLVVSAVHTGSFARPSSENNNLDFRTPYGDELKQTFNITSYPAILINRRATAITSIGDWATKIAEKMASTSHNFNISLGAEILEGKNILVSAKIDVLKTVDSELSLTLYVTESGIEGIQNVESEHQLYTFKHVLRENPLKDMPLANSFKQGDVIEKNYLITGSDKWVKENCAVVVMITDNATGEVLQVNEIEL